MTVVSEGRSCRYTTLVFHTNTMEDKDFEKYERMFEENKTSFISYADYMKQKPCKRTVFGHVWEYGMATLKHFLVKLRAGR